MPAPTVKSRVVYRFSDQDILARVAESLSDGSMAFKVDLVSATFPPIEIGNVGILDLTNTQINPATEGTLQAILAALGGDGGGDVHEPHQSLSPVAQGSTDTHSHTVAAGKSLILEQLVFGAQGYVQAELWVGPAGSEVYKGTFFNTPSNLTKSIPFERPIPASAGWKVLVKKTNIDPDGNARILYDTIIGREA